MRKLSELETKIGYCFKQKALLKTALTHRSYSNNHNERLEFLGDAVLELSVSSLLYINYPNLPEGELSRIRSNVVCKEVLAQIAIDLNLSNYIYLGMGELKSGGLKKPSILADAVEGILGAIYLESGLEISTKIVGLWLKDKILDNLKSKKDNKSELQEYLQSRKLPTPQYILLKAEGCAHEQTFTVECKIPSQNLFGVGNASTKKEAEQIAANLVLEQISKK